MTITSLPTELAEFVNQELAGGRYGSAEEIVCAGLRLLQEREQRIEELRREIDIGREATRRGEVVHLPDKKAQQAFLADLKAG